MAAINTRTARTAPAASGCRGRAIAGLTGWAATAVAVAAVDLTTTVHQSRIVSTADYVFTVLLIPLVLAPLVALPALHRLHAGRDGKSGRVGLIITMIGMAGFVPCAIASLLTRDPQAFGPVYLLSMLASVIGLVTFAIATARTRMLPRWAVPALAAGWIVGGPVGESGPTGFPGSALLLAAACAAVASTLSRQS